MKKILLSAVFIIGFTYAQNFTLTIPELEANGLTEKQMFNQFGCEGENMSPKLQWENIPKGTKSLVFTVYDPDAPSGSGWWHWVVANISPETMEIAESGGAIHELMPDNSWTVRNDYGAREYGGICPPEGRVHRYQFTLYALDIEYIPVSETISPAFIGFMANHHMIEKTTVSYNFSR